MDGIKKEEEKDDQYYCEWDMEEEEEDKYQVAEKTLKATNEMKGSK